MIHRRKIIARSAPTYLYSTLRTLRVSVSSFLLDLADDTRASREIAHGACSVCVTNSHTSRRVDAFTCTEPGAPFLSPLIPIVAVVLSLSLFPLLASSRLASAGAVLSVSSLIYISRQWDTTNTWILSTRGSSHRGMPRSYFYRNPTTCSTAGDGGGCRRRTRMPEDAWKCLTACVRTHDALVCDVWSIDANLLPSLFLSGVIIIGNSPFAELFSRTEETFRSVDSRRRCCSFDSLVSHLHLATMRRIRNR